jgi:hypothetical protein
MIELFPVVIDRTKILGGVRAYVVPAFIAAAGHWRLAPPATSRKMSSVVSLISGSPGFGRRRR